MQTHDTWRRAAAGRGLAFVTSARPAASLGPVLATHVWYTHNPDAVLHLRSGTAAALMCQRSFDAYRHHVSCRAGAANGGAETSAGAERAGASMSHHTSWADQPHGSPAQALLTEAPQSLQKQDLTEAAAPLVALLRTGGLPQRGAAAAAVQVTLDLKPAEMRCTSGLRREPHTQLWRTPGVAKCQVLHAAAPSMQS